MRQRQRKPAAREVERAMEQAESPRTSADHRRQIYDMLRGTLQTHPGLPGWQPQAKKGPVDEREG